MYAYRAHDPTRPCRLTVTFVVSSLALGLVASWSLGAKAEVAGDEARALARDLSRIVELREETGWGIDHYDFEAMLPTALRSVCRTPEEAWPHAQQILDDSVNALGGDPQSMYEESDQSLEAIEDLMTAWRTSELLRLARAQRDRCPFWMQKQTGFPGLHSEEGRWSLSLEGGGLFVGRIADDELRFGGGGGGRFTVGAGVSESWDLRGGVGFGGGALADRSVTAENIDIDFFVDAPIIVRHSGVLWRQEIEVAPIATGIPWQGPMQLGIRFGGLIGVGYLRLREVLPWAGLGLYGEYSFAQGGLPDFWTVRVGIRVGVSWSSLDD